MATLSPDVERRLKRLPSDLELEFPDVPPAVIQREVDDGVRGLVESARFNDFVPVLVHRAVRERLRQTPAPV